MMRALLVILIFSPLLVFCYGRHGHLMLKPDEIFVEVDGASGSIVKVWEGPHHRHHFYVLTAQHVVDGMDVVPVRFFVGKGRHKFKRWIMAYGEIVEENAHDDFAIVHVESDIPLASTHIKCATMAELCELSSLEPITSIGNPNWMTGWTAHGTICKRMDDGRIAHDAGIFYGSSGGPLIHRGKQIGINVELRAYRGLPLTFLGIATNMEKVYKRLGTEKTAKYFSF